MRTTFPSLPTWFPWQGFRRMTRSNKTQRSQFNRRAIRLALCIALSSNAAWALADDVRGTGVGTSTVNCSMEMPELPAYPFPAANASVQQCQLPKAQSSKQVIIRLLGYSAAAKPVAAPSASPTSLPMSLPASIPMPSLPTMDQPVALVQPQLLQPVAEPLMHTDLAAAQAMIEHPAAVAVELGNQVATTSAEHSITSSALSPVPSHSMHLAVGARPAMPLDTNVIVAGATRLAKPVEASFSDSSEASDSGDSSESLVDDLVNSMVSNRQAAAVKSTPASKAASTPNARQAQESSGFTDTIRMDIADEPEAVEHASESISMSMSDRSDRSDLSVASATEAPQPSLVNTRQSLTLRTMETAESNGGRLTDSEQPTKLQSLSQLPLSIPSPTSLAQQMATQSAGGLVAASGESVKRIDNPNFDSAVQAAVSSRREVTTVASVEAKPETGNATSRLPLVPMLTSVPVKSPSHTAPRALQAVPTQSQVQTAAPSQFQTPVPTPSQTPVSGRESMNGKEFKVAVKDSFAVQSIETIQTVSVEHEEVCQVIKSGPKSFTVVGLQDGETRIAVISEVDGQRKVQVHHVVVGTPKSTTTTNPAALASEVSQTVAQLYPRSRVRITPRGTQLVVSGSVDSEDTAKKILSLVRKTTLNPVIDELQTK